MKMITAIVNKKDAGGVCAALSEEGFVFTKLSTVGGFLRMGNTTLLIGVEDDQLEKAMDMIRSHCARRMEKVPQVQVTEMHNPVYAPYPSEVMVGGAIVFVTDVAVFEKM